MPGCRISRSFCVALMMKERSGSPVLRNGVGTQMLTPSTCRRSATSVVAFERAGADERTQPPRWNILDIAVASLDGLHLVRVQVQADHLQPAFRQGHGQRQTDVAQTDHRYASLLALEAFDEPSGRPGQLSGIFSHGKSSQ